MYFIECLKVVCATDELGEVLSDEYGLLEEGYMQAVE
jgi:hypothetical protein